MGGFSGNRSPAIVLAGLVFIAATFASCLSEKGSPPPAVLSTDVDYGILSWDNVAFFNNCWQRGALSRPELAFSRISYDPGAGRCSWVWSWPEERKDLLKGYPALFVGDKVYSPPGFDRSTDPRFPLHLPDMRSLWASGKVAVEGEGDFDFAYDLVFLEGNVSKPEAARCEIMVWLDMYKACPAARDRDYSVDGSTYALYINTDWNPGVPYLAFTLAPGSLRPTRVPLHEFIQIAIDRGYLDPDAYLAAVELGPEIWWGTGRASVEGFGVEANGK